MADDTTPTTPRPAAKPEVWRPIFLKELERTANVSRAAQKAGIYRTSAYNARDESPEFAQAWDDVMESALDNLEEAGRKRAKATSDTLLMFFLKAHRRKVYGDTSTINLGGTDGGPVKVAHTVEPDSIAAFRATLASLGLAVDMADAGAVLPAPTD